MAEPENTEKNEQNAERKSPGKSSKLVTLCVPMLAVALCAAGGFVVGRLFGARGATQNVAAAESAPELSTPLPPIDETAAGPTWYYDMEPVVANLNEPGVTRYARLTLTLEIGGNLTEKDGLPFLEQRKPLLKNWLTLFMANLTLEDIRGERKLRQVQTQIADVFNQGLFPNAQPCIKRVLFKEMSIQ
jgi:flagellar basal body-associated protein FliL